MAKDDSRIAELVLEREPDKPGDVSEARVLSPMSDFSAKAAGHILVSWGQMADTLLRYTKCLISHNGSDPIATKNLEFRRLQRRFKEESDKAFMAAPTAHAIVEKFLRLANHAKSVREGLAHDRIYWSTFKGKDSISVNMKTSAGIERILHLTPDRLESTLQEIGIAHGQLLHLQLKTQFQPPYTSTEISLLQAIAAKGFLKLPNLDKQLTLTGSSWA